MAFPARNQIRAGGCTAGMVLHCLCGRTTGSGACDAVPAYRRASGCRDTVALPYLILHDRPRENLSDLALEVVHDFVAITPKSGDVKLAPERTDAPRLCDAATYHWRYFFPWSINKACPD
ncbi:hypothetical protein [Streptomyces sp. NBC_01578]|uniref:hypothetical protein n=1 Tax=unclassified Streptomyces TaxID=2593676 RepID=UPI00386F3D9E